jgi:hypothetical protein
VGVADGVAVLFKHHPVDAGHRNHSFVGFFYTACVADIGRVDMSIESKKAQWRALVALEAKLRAYF